MSMIVAPQPDAAEVGARIPAYVCEALEARGLKTLRSVQAFIAARVQATHIDGGRLDGASDPGGQGMALGV
jgi:gamma-glutamyltranspeptidase